MNPVKLYWSGGNRNEVNFGDTISPMIVEALSGRPVAYASPKDCEMVAIGSVLNKIAVKKWKRYFSLRFSPVHVWGSGSFSAESLGRASHLAIHAVRGPKTKEALGLTGDVVYGDPGLLVSDIIPVKAGESKARWGIIPHVHDRQSDLLARISAALKGSVIIDLGDRDLSRTARMIAGCDFILSTSLHGMITADSYGIPNAWMKISENVVGSDWKFNDYFLSVSRTVRQPLVLPDEFDKLATLESYLDVASPEIVEERKNGLLQAFRNIGL